MKRILLSLIFTVCLIMSVLTVNVFSANDDVTDTTMIRVESRNNTGDDCVMKLNKYYNKYHKVIFTRTDEDVQIYGDASIKSSRKVGYHHHCTPCKCTVCKWAD